MRPLISWRANSHLRQVTLNGSLGMPARLPEALYHDILGHLRGHPGTVAVVTSAKRTQKLVR